MQPLTVFNSLNKQENGWYLCKVENSDWSETAASCSSGEDEMREFEVEEGEHKVGRTSILEKEGWVVIGHELFGLDNWSWW